MAVVVLTVVTVGTSIEFGTHLASPGEAWPQRVALRWGQPILDRSLPGGSYTHPFADGQTIRTSMDAAVAELHPDILIVGGPVNDLVTLSDVTPLRQAVFEAVNAAHAAGVPKVLVMAILPINDGGNPAAFTAGWWPSLEPRRIAYNTWAQQMYGANFIDLGWCMHETTTWRGDVRFYRDGLHPTRFGAAMVAEAFPLELLG